jgi:predicted RNase H-like nuclease
MRAVLGIDAAWTTTAPSGVALVEAVGERWRLICVKEAYWAFYDLAASNRLSEPGQCNSLPDAGRLIETSRKLCGGCVDLVAIDMPLARVPITGRRVSDNAVSSAYGARGCGTHSPSRARPGLISQQLTAEFDRAGYPLRTLQFSPPGLVEVYPHPALVELAKASMRLPYKLSKIRLYWPAHTADERKALLLREWSQIVDLLEAEIAGVSAALPALLPDASRAELKSYEDKLDAVICAWSGIRVLEGRAAPFGDQDSAIWIPAG